MGDAPDWSALARLRTTLVIFMGLNRIESICTQLVLHGMSAATPAAVIEQGTLSTQRHVSSPLAGLARAARTAQLKAPALIVIGDVVALARVTEASRQADAAQASA